MCDHVLDVMFNGLTSPGKAALSFAEIVAEAAQSMDFIMWNKKPLKVVESIHLIVRHATSRPR
jgi:hypothetical protein